MRLNKFAILLLISQIGFTQPATTGKIKTVSKAGLHKIMLPAEVRSFSKEDLSDFRIYDSQNREVPYFLVEGNSSIVLQDFQEYTLIKNNSVPKKFTSYIIDTGSENKRNGLSLNIANSDMTKHYTVSGSNDQKQWYGIANNGILSDLNDPENTMVTKDISFPLSAYRYLKMVFNDSITLPINLMRAGIRKHEIRENNLQGIEPESIKTTLSKEQKLTVINVIFKHKQIINRIDFDIKSPRYYKRPVAIYKDATRKVRRKNIAYNEFICGFELFSQAKTSFNLPQVFLKEIEVEINNYDNQPLEISSIHFSQLPAYAIADLDPNESYTIKTGNAKLTKPQYDLAELATKNLGSYPETQVFEVVHDAKFVAQTKEKSFWQQPWFMWICIGLGGLSLLFFTVRLVKDMK